MKDKLLTYEEIIYKRLSDLTEDSFFKEVLERAFQLLEQKVTCGYEPYAISINWTQNQRKERVVEIILLWEHPPHIQRIQHDVGEEILVDHTQYVLLINVEQKVYDWKLVTSVGGGNMEEEEEEEDEEEYEEEQYS